jgi:multidrug resistance efflux pump
MVRAQLHHAYGEPEQATAALRRADQLADQSTQATAMLGVQLARFGNALEARTVLNRLQQLAQTRYVPPTSLAAVHAALGEMGLALDALEGAWMARDTRLAYLKDDQRWIALRNEPRFIKLLNRLNLNAYGPGITGP